MSISCCRLRDLILVNRERVYCYELYHQMRLLWPKDSVYRLNGEVDKVGHPYFGAGGAPKPDLLVHQPGHRNNYAIGEVKPWQAVTAGIRKDLTTLALFRNEFWYERAIYLIYGPAPNDMLAKVQECGVKVPHFAGIEVWLHRAPTEPAELIGITV
jgi:hypothetical protein